MISEDVELSKLLFEKSENHPELEAVSQNLSITTFRYIPLDHVKNHNDKNVYLNTLNEEIVNNLQTGGEVFLSNAIVNEKYCLRACIVNFRTSNKDIEEIIEIVLKTGRKTHANLKKNLPI